MTVVTAVNSIDHETRSPVQRRFTTTFGVDALYTGQTMAMYDRAPLRIPDTLQTLLAAVAEATGTDFNFVLMNFYQDGTHSISYHSDDEKFLGIPVCFGLASWCAS